MKKSFTLILCMMVAWVFACGGGGDTSDKPAAKKKTPKAMSGYQTMAVVDGGSITGKVTFGGAMPSKQKLEITKDVAICGKEAHYNESMVVSGDKGLANVVVSIKNISKGKGMDAMGSSFVLDQKVCSFKPHVSVVPVGATLVILNSDGILHNIHTFSEANKPINIAQPKFKKRINQSFKKPEVITVKCDVHNWMGGYIVVVGHPYHAKTDASGNFSITDVPAGTYTVEFWQESLGKKSMEVTVPAGGSADASTEFAVGS